MDKTAFLMGVCRVSWTVAASAVLSLAVIVFGGVYYPNTLAGAVARFVFSLN